jgi:Family of unknown function (DUF6130)
MDPTPRVWFHALEEDSMKPLERLSHRIAFRAGIIAFAAIMVLALPSASARRAGPATQAATAALSAKEVRGASPYIEIKNEPAPKLIVDPPLPDLLDQGVVWIQWRAENVHIVPVFGKGALNASPRVGHLHVHVDDLPWWWADPSNINTIDLAGMPPGPHKIRIELVNANHEVFPGQSKTVTFTVPKGASRSHSH